MKLNCRDSMLFKKCLIILGIIFYWVKVFKVNQWKKRNAKISKAITLTKWTNGLSGNDYKVATCPTFSYCYRIPMQSLKSTGQF